MTDEPRRTEEQTKAGPLAWLLILPIRFYQKFITPYTPATCKYYPTCSAYAVTALRRHGALKGSWLTLRRLGRCHPWSSGGVDHVPPRQTSSPDVQLRNEGREPTGLLKSSSTGTLSHHDVHRLSQPVTPGSTPDPPGRSTTAVRPDSRSTAA